MNQEKIRLDLLNYVFKKSDEESINEIDLDKSLLVTGVLDSFAIIELVEFIESNWTIRIEDEDFNSEKMGSINKMTALISEKLSV